MFERWLEIVLTECDDYFVWWIGSFDLNLCPALCFSYVPCGHCLCQALLLLLVCYAVCQSDTCPKRALHLLYANEMNKKILVITRSSPLGVIPRGIHLGRRRPHVFFWSLGGSSVWCVCIVCVCVCVCLCVTVSATICTVVQYKCSITLRASGLGSAQEVLHLGQRVDDVACDDVSLFLGIGTESWSLFNDWVKKCSISESDGLQTVNSCFAVPLRLEWASQTLTLIWWMQCFLVSRLISLFSNLDYPVTDEEWYQFKRNHFWKNFGLRLYEILLKSDYRFSVVQFIPEF